jgi:preprotein translocase subunit SecD
MLEYARWKYVLVVAVLLLGMLFALPNVFGEDPALQVARKDRAPVATDAGPAIEGYLKERGVTFEKSYIDSGRLMLRFPNVPSS